MQLHLFHWFVIRCKLLWIIKWITLCKRTQLNLSLCLSPSLSGQMSISHSISLKLFILFLGAIYYSHPSWINVSLVDSAMLQVPFFLVLCHRIINLSSHISLNCLSVYSDALTWARPLSVCPCLRLVLLSLHLFRFTWHAFASPQTVSITLVTFSFYFLTGHTRISVSAHFLTTRSSDWNAIPAAG